MFRQIKEVSQLTGYCEINEHYKGMADEVTDSVFEGTPWGTFSAWKNEDMENLWSKLGPICDKKLKRIMIGEANHIWRAFKSLFGGKLQQ